MAKVNKEKTYWPHMILGFLAVGITLSYWTVKSATSRPVQESNDYMLKYQQADINMNEILKKKALFDQSYSIEIMDTKNEIIEIENAKRTKEEYSVILKKGMNSFKYRVTDKNNILKKDANVTFLLTRPHSVREDKLVENIALSGKTFYIKDINITKPGRYTLQLRAKIGDAIGYSQLPAYLKP